MTLMTEYRVRFQRAADDNDSRGCIDLTGTNFSDLCIEARNQGYPRIINAESREIGEWRPVDYPYDEVTP